MSQRRALGLPPLATSGSWRGRFLAGVCSLPALLACAAGCFFVTSAQAEDFYNPRTTFGEVGLLEMPSARTAPDGELSLTAGVLGGGTQHYNLGFQILPWLEASFRYSRVPDFFGKGPLSSLFDRSFGLKIRLTQESEYFPEVALGIRDIVGTGIYSGEYIVGSKRIGQDFDVSLGLGWGRFAQRPIMKNPFAAIFPSFETRDTTFGLGGTIAFGQFFHGPKVGLFGGVLWRTPVEDLDLLVEYSSDKYSLEGSRGGFRVRSPVNVGLAYHFYDVGTLSAGWFYGTSYGVTLSLAADPTVSVSPHRFGPDSPQPYIRPPKQQLDALSLLLKRNRPGNLAAASGPWVRLPPPKSDPDSLALVSALMSEGGGVRDVDVMGHTLVVDAQLTQVANRQCDRYANIVSAFAPRLETIALSDLKDPSGQVAICKIAHRSSLLADDGAAVPPADEPPPAAPTDPASAARKIRDDVAAQSIQVDALSVEPEMVWLYFTNGRYASESEAAGRIARVLMADAPSSVEVFHLVSLKNGLPMRELQIARSALERATAAYGTALELGEAVSLVAPPLSNPVLERAQDDSYPQLNWKIGPDLREGFFDPARPLQVLLLAALNVDFDITPNLMIEGRAEANIFNNYDPKQTSDSLLPHVRSDYSNYIRHGINGVAKLDAAYRTRFSRELYFEAKAGYLEDMFAGAGAQILWRPEGQRLSFGADLYQVWQRNFDRLAGLQNYHVLTGHVSAYYASPWYGLNFAVHAGRYLAGDYGATFEITRRFSTGIEVGAFATFTNVPFAKFGEGSFDKGIIIHIPLEWALPFYSQSSYDLLLRSLTRDGGQRLDFDDSLFEETRATSYGEMQEHIDEIAAP